MLELVGGTVGACRKTVEEARVVELLSSGGGGGGMTIRPFR